MMMKQHTGGWHWKGRNSICTTAITLSSSVVPKHLRGIVWDRSNIISCSYWLLLWKNGALSRKIRKRDWKKKVTNNRIPSSRSWFNKYMLPILVGVWCTSTPYTTVHTWGWHYCILYLEIMTLLLTQLRSVTGHFTWCVQQWSATWSKFILNVG